MLRVSAVTVNTAVGQQGRPGHSVTLGTGAMGLFLSFDPREDKMPRKTLDGSVTAGPRRTDWKAKLPSLHRATIVRPEVEQPLLPLGMLTTVVFAGGLL